MKAKLLLIALIGISTAAAIWLLSQSISIGLPVLDLSASPVQSEVPKPTAQSSADTSTSEVDSENPVGTTEPAEPTKQEAPSEQSQNNHGADTPSEHPQNNDGVDAKQEADTEAETAPPVEEKNWWEYPDEILPVQGDPSDLDVVVNKKYKLPADYVPSDLVTFSGYRLAGRALKPLQNLLQAAKDDGIDLTIVSAYRSYQTQQSTYNYWLQYNGGNQSLTDQVSARPGHSEHQLGTAVDFSTPEIGNVVGEAFNSTTAAKWLAENAEKFGFTLSYPEGKEEETGYAYEGWHYRFR
ncbi:D-alanyl-D-alanine carboxypeptidase family protein [Candidatus Nomurabacteria bacterium]|nr:D-alanyl-D-alanine carboxypeptidase family protein [Candidatus Nomurabacteria bacterium]